MIDSHETLTFTPLPKTQSYSSMKLYEQCPSKYKFYKIDKLPDSSGPAAERGKVIHSEIESYLNKETENLSDETKSLQEQLDSFRSIGAQSEVEFAVDHYWNKIDFNHAFAMFRGIIDVLHVDGDSAMIVDWKTGKIRDYEDQLNVYATVILSIMPTVQVVNLFIQYVDTPKLVKYASVSRKDLTFWQERLATRLKAIETDTIHAANPSWLCRYCNYRKSNGGACKW